MWEAFIAKMDFLDRPKTAEEELPSPGEVGIFGILLKKPNNGPG
jgi:hypothetical protein